MRCGVLVWVVWRCVWAEAGRWEVCSVVWWCGVVVRKRFRVRAWAGRWVGGVVQGERAPQT